MFKQGRRSKISWKYGKNASARDWVGRNLFLRVVSHNQLFGAHHFRFQVRSGFWAVPQTECMRRGIVTLRLRCESDEFLHSITDTYSYEDILKIYLAYQKYFVGQNLVKMNCPIFFSSRCLLILAVQDKMLCCGNRWTPSICYGC